MLVCRALCLLSCFLFCFSLGDIKKRMIKAAFKQKIQVGAFFFRQSNMEMAGNGKFEITVAIANHE